MKYAGWRRQDPCRSQTFHDDDLRSHRPFLARSQGWYRRSRASKGGEEERGGSRHTQAVPVVELITDTERNLRSRSEGFRYEWCCVTDKSCLCCCTRCWRFLLLFRSIYCLVLVLSFLLTSIEVDLDQPRSELQEPRRKMQIRYQSNVTHSLAEADRVTTLTR